MIKKISTIILILIAVAIAAIARNNADFEDITTFASTPDLQITWQGGSPIFNIANMLPGDTATGKVTVKNISTSIKPIGIRGRQTSVNPNDFPTQLKLKIYENNILKKDYSLSQFFTDSNSQAFIDFADLAPNAQSEYKFEVLFDPNSNDDFQNASVIFDIIIGIFFELPAECQAWGEDRNTRFVFGTDKKDTLTGNNYKSVLVGFGGDDMLNGNNQEDCLIGGPGNDKLHGNNKNDVLLGGSGNNDLFGGNGTDLCKDGNKKSCEL